MSGAATAWTTRAAPGLVAQESTSSALSSFSMIPLLRVPPVEGKPLIGCGVVFPRPGHGIIAATSIPRRHPMRSRLSFLWAASPLVVLTCLLGGALAGCGGTDLPADFSEPLGEQ